MVSETYCLMDTFMFSNISALRLQELEHNATWAAVKIRELIEKFTVTIYACTIVRSLQQVVSYSHKADYIHI